MKEILLVGSNPSVTSPDITAFHPDTRSRIVLDSWFIDIDADISYANICDQRMPNNRPLRISEIQECLPSLLNKINGYDKVIALGKAASRALSMAEVSYFAAPHPSGLNRFWNDGVKAAWMIQSIRDYVCGDSDDL